VGTVLAAFFRGVVRMGWSMGDFVFSWLGRRRSWAGERDPARASHG
jgi:hypothetical protein